MNKCTHDERFKDVFYARNGCIACELEDAHEEIKRLKRSDFTEEEFQNLCHNLSEDDECRFKEGCTEYQNKLFGKNQEPRCESQVQLEVPDSRTEVPGS